MANLIQLFHPLNPLNVIEKAEHELEKFLAENPGWQRLEAAIEKLKGDATDEVKAAESEATADVDKLEADAEQIDAAAGDAAQTAAAAVETAAEPAKAKAPATKS